MSACAISKQMSLQRVNGAALAYSILLHLIE